ncbi:MAG: ParB N-terminal domain-containing protein [Burkholderiaceae bacterium]|nr:ParB N-terminal domain-containing protein [Burkholderiaceae bacterium]
MNPLNVEYRKVETLIPYARNPRTHNDGQISKIAASIVEYGWTNPILVDGGNGIIAGHGRLAAARKLELADVPVIELAHLTSAQKRAYVIADNRLALDAGWDEEMLALELAELSEGGFDLALTGLDATELQSLLADEEDYEQAAAMISPEEWRNQIVAEKIAVLKWWEGAAAALYDLGGKAKVADIAEHRFIQAITAANGSNRNVRQTLWRTLQNHTVDESTTVKMKKRLSPAVFDKAADSVWQFAGDWRDDCADLIALVDQLKRGQQDAGAVQRYSFVTFHQSYGYEEFVEGLRPVLAGDAEAGEVAYEIRPGAFKELCRKARQAPDQRFAMVIDEINRGNISKIFGELITLIEADKRDPLDGSAPPVEVVLAYSGEKFSVPANVDIIGTMNTADRSLALLDTALRRRFDFEPLLPDTRADKVLGEKNSAPLAGLVVTTDVGLIDVRLMLERINERIEALYDRDHCIGHAYLTGLARVTDGPQRFDALASTFRQRIVPLLEEYFFEDWRKIRLVLGDNQKPDVASQFVGESNAHEQDLTLLFGNDHGLDSYATKRRYSLREGAFGNPAAYIGIYQTAT